MPRYDKPIEIQKVDEATEDWGTVFKLHAQVNSSKSSEYYQSGSERNQFSLTFTVRYFKDLEPVIQQPQIYRVIYRNMTFNLTGYDDFMESRHEIKLVGESYGT